MATMAEEQTPPAVVAIHIAPASRLPMVAVERAEVHTGGGIEGDRYEHSRHRHVTVQSATQLAEAAEAHGNPIAPGDTRRNITISHGQVPASPGDRFSIGQLELEVVRIAAPCRLLDDVIGPGAKDALRRRAGSVCRVLSGGTIAVGDHMGERSEVRFRPMVEDDLVQLAGWLAEPHVRRWWGPELSLHEVRAKYLPRLRGEVPTDMFVVTIDGVGIGMFQRYLLADHPEWAGQLETAGLALPSAVGIDYLLGEPSRAGQGIGTEMLRSLVAHLARDLAEVTHVVAAPQADNVASCRALARAGFELRWTGKLPSEDPADDGPSAVYVRALR